MGLSNYLRKKKEICLNFIGKSENKDKVGKKKLGGKHNWHKPIKKVGKKKFGKVQ